MTACVTFGTAIKHTEKNTSSTLFPSSFFFSQGKISISRSNLFPSQPHTYYRFGMTTTLVERKTREDYILATCVGWCGGLYNFFKVCSLKLIDKLFRSPDPDKYRDFLQLISFSAKRQHHIQNLLISLWKMYHLETQIASWALGQFIWNQLEQLRQGLKTFLY